MEIGNLVSESLDFHICCRNGVVSGGSEVKNLPAMQEMQIRSLGQEDALEKEMASHSSILAWRIPWTEETGGLYSPRGHKESDTTERLNFNFNFMHWLQ